MNGIEMRGMDARRVLVGVSPTTPSPTTAVAQKALSTPARVCKQEVVKEYRRQLRNCPKIT